MQFDVYSNPSARSQERYPYLVDIQNNLLAGLPTRMVMPLALTAPEDFATPKRLCPTILVKGKMLSLVPFEAAPIDKRLLKKRVASIREFENDILAASDAVFSGL